MKYIVIAGSSIIYNAWWFRNPELRRDARYITQPDKLRGLTADEVTIVFLHGCWLNKVYGSNELRWLLDRGAKLIREDI